MCVTILYVSCSSVCLKIPYKEIALFNKIVVTQRYVILWAILKIIDSWYSPTPMKHNSSCLKTLQILRFVFVTLKRLDYNRNLCRHERAILENDNVNPKTVLISLVRIKRHVSMAVIFCPHPTEPCNLVYDWKKSEFLKLKCYL